TYGFSPFYRITRAASLAARPARLLLVPHTRARKRCTMSISAQTLTQAREALIEAATQRLSLLQQIKEQGKKIIELEREVQKLATNFSQAQQALVDARSEIEALRAQLPDAATINAYERLVDYMTAPADIHP